MSTRRSDADRMPVGRLPYRAKSSPQARISGVWKESAPRQLARSLPSSSVRPWSGLLATDATGIPVLDRDAPDGIRQGTI